MKILITGATGFIGTHLVKELQQHNYTIKILTRQKASNLQNVETIQGDITNPSSYDQALSDVDAVFHNAAYAADYGKKSIIFDINVTGTKHLADLCEKHNIKKIVYTSSSGVYGFPNNNKTITETSAKQPLNPYQQSKLDAENLLQTYNSITVSSILPPLVLGPGGMGTKILMDRMKQGKMVYIGSGKNTISLVHPEDVAQCLRLALEKDTNGTSFNVVSFQCEMETLLSTLAKKMQVDPPQKHIPYSIAYFAASFMERFSKQPSFTRFRVKTLGTSRFISSEKATKLLGYQPKHNLQTTIEDMAQWYKTI